MWDFLAGVGVGAAVVMTWAAWQVTRLSQRR